MVWTELQTPSCSQKFKCDKVEFSSSKFQAPTMQTVTSTRYEELKQQFGKFVVLFQVSFLILLFILIYLSPNIIITIKPGEAGIFWSRFFGGTQIEDIYPEGIHFIFPWDQMYIYNVRYQIKEHELEVLTSRGLNVHLYLSIRYAPVYPFLGVLHQRVGPDYVNIVIIPEVTAVLRETIGTLDSEEIYTTGRKVITIAINEAIEQVEQRFIQIDDVLIKRIDLPPMVAESIKYKIQQKHLIEAHEFIVQKEKKEADRKRIEAQGIRDHLNTIAQALPKGEILTWKGINATENLAHSNNAKIVLIGAGSNGLPLILNTDSSNNKSLPSTSLSNTPNQYNHEKTPPILDLQSKIPELSQQNLQYSQNKDKTVPVIYTQSSSSITSAPNHSPEKLPERQLPDNPNSSQ